MAHDGSGVGTEWIAHVKNLRFWRITLGMFVTPDISSGYVASMKGQAFVGIFRWMRSRLKMALFASVNAAGFL